VIIGGVWVDAPKFRRAGVDVDVAALGTAADGIVVGLVGQPIDH
jgi:hypothetical protein